MGLPSRLKRRRDPGGPARFVATLQGARPKGIALIATAVALAGFWSAVNLPIEWLPQIELPRLTLSAPWPGAAPQTLERRVTSVLEGELGRMPGTEALTSYSRPGMAVLHLEVAEHRDIGLYAAEVADRLAAIRSALPEGVIPRLEYEVPAELRDEKDFMTLEIAGSLEPVALRRLADEVVAPGLRSLPGIAAVDIEGGVKREVRVTYNRDRLMAHDLSLGDLRSSLADALVESHLGSIRRAERRIELLIPAVDEPSGIESLAMVSEGGQGPMVRLGDVSRIQLAAAPTEALRRIDGRPAVTVGLDRTPGSDMLGTADDVRSYIRDMADDLPADVAITVADDRSVSVREALSDLLLKAVLGLLAIAGVLLAGLRYPRAVFAVLASATVALSAALALMAGVGLSLNIFTFAGLVLLVGLLVDNGTMLAERLLVELRRAEVAEATARALRSIWLPLLGCSATTALVFVPMVYASGELRALFEPLAILTASTLAFSMLSTAILVPIIMGGVRIERARPGRWRKFLLLPYAAAASYPRLTLLLLAAVMGLPLPLLPDVMDEPAAGWQDAQHRETARRYNMTLGSDPVRHIRRWTDPMLGGVTRPFLEQVDIGQDWNREEASELITFLRLPPGSGAAQVDHEIRRFEEVVLRSGLAERTMIRVVGDLAVMRNTFEDEVLATEGPFRLREELIAHALQLAGIEIGIAGLTSTGFYSGLGQVSGVQLQAHGPSWEGLDAQLRDFARRLETEPRVAEVDLDSQRQATAAARESLRLRWNGIATARSGVDAGRVAELMRSRLDHTWPSFHTHFRDEGRLGVRLVAESAHRTDLKSLLSEPLPAGAGRGLRLAGLGEIERATEQRTIERKNQQYQREIRVLFRGPHHLAVDFLDRELAAIDLPVGYSIERPRVDRFGQQDDLHFVLLCCGLLLLVFVVMAGVLESWRLAGWVLISTPTAWVGIALGFLWSGQPFADGAFFGVLLTVGIGANAGILLAARYRELWVSRPATSPRHLVLLALRDRLPPLWTTTLTTSAGMLPLLLLPDEGTFWPSFALTVCGGVTAAALLAPAATVALAGLLPASEPRSGGPEQHGVATRGSVPSVGGERHISPAS